MTIKFRNVVWLWAWLWPGLLCVAHAAGAEQITLQALFANKAIVLVDGKRRVLTQGETSPEGVKLLATDTRDETADIEMDGKRQQLKLGVVLSSFASVGKGSITLYPDRGGHFFTDGSINGTPVRFLVDTGATSVALNSGTANRAGIDYKRFGRVGAANTAGGIVRTYYLKLDKVQVGDIVMQNVDAAVIEGAHPTDVLLGMSFLGSLDMRRDSEKLELRER